MSGQCWATESPADRVDSTCIVACYRYSRVIAESGTDITCRLTRHFLSRTFGWLMHAGRERYERGYLEHH